MSDVLKDNGFEFLRVMIERSMELCYFGMDLWFEIWVNDVLCGVF